MRSKPSPLETFPGCERRLNRKLVAVQSGANGIGFKTQKLLDLAIATDGLEARIEYEIGHDDLLIVNTKSGLTQRADDHTRKIDLARELSGYPRLFPQFSNRAASKRFAGQHPAGSKRVELTRVSTLDRTATRYPQTPVGTNTVDVDGTVLQTQGTKQTALAAGEFLATSIEHSAKFVTPIADQAELA